MTERDLASQLRIAAEIGLKQERDLVSVTLSGRKIVTTHKVKQP